MRNFSPFLQKGLATLFAFFCLNFTFGQLTVTENTPDSMTVCNGDYTFEYTLTTGILGVNSVSIMPTLPPGITYTGNLSINAIELVNDPNNPVFGVSTIAPSTSIIVSYTGKASCDIIPSTYTDTLAPQFINVQNVTSVTYLIGASPQPAINLTTSYNLLYAKLNISVQTPTGFSNVMLGDVFPHTLPPNRIITVQNGGIGSTDTVIIRITPEPEIDYSNGGFFTAVGSISLPWSFVGSDIEILLTGTDLQDAILPFPDGNGDQVLDFDERIQIIEDFEVVACSPTDIQNEYQVLWGCNSQFCNENYTNSQASSNVAISAFEPSVVATKITPAVDISNYCGQDGYLEFMYINSGTAPGGWANNLILDIRYDPGEMITLSDFSINGNPVVDGLNGIHVVDTMLPSDCAGSVGIYQIPTIRFDFSNDTVGVGNMSNFGDDNFYDDLAPGDTIVIRYKLHIKDSIEFFDLCNDLDIALRLGEASCTYESQCGKTFCTPRAYNQYYGYSIYGGHHFTNAPTDIVENQPATFTFCTAGWTPFTNVDILACSVDSFYLNVYVPPGFQLAPSPNLTWTSAVSGLTVPLSGLQSGDTITIGGGGHDPADYNAHEKWSGCYTLDLVVACDPGLSLSNTVSWDMMYICDTCDLVQRRACGTANVFAHVACLDSLCNGIQTTYFDMNRNSFGWTDSSFNYRANANTPGIDLHAAYPCDSLLSHVGGKVISMNFDSVFVQYTYTGNNTLLNSLSGTFFIYDSTGVFVTSCPAPPPVITTSGTTTNISFFMPCQGSLSVGDSIVFVDSLMVGNTGILNDQNIPDLRAMFYVIEDSAQIICDTWGANLRLNDPITYFFSNLENSNYNKCGAKGINLSFSFANMHSPQDFPNEFRHDYHLFDTIKFIMPAGYILNTNAPATVPYYPEGSTIAYDIDTISPVLILGDTLYFVHNWALVDRVQSSYNIAFTVNIDPTCEADDTVFTAFDYNWIHKDYTTSTACSDTVYGKQWWQTNPTYDGFDYTPLEFNKPNLTTSVIGSITAEGYSNTVSYLVQICNQPYSTGASGTAENIWFDFDNFLSNDGHMVVESVVEVTAGSPVMPLTAYTQNSDSSAFVEIGNLVSSQCRTFQVTVSYTNCTNNDVDTLRMLSGWNCGSYPLPLEADTALCQISENNLILRYHAANLTMFVTEPTGTYGICDTIPYEVLLTSTDPATMYDVNFWLNIPPNVTLLNFPQYLYPLSGIWTDFPTAPTTIFDGLGWNLSTTIPGLISNNNSLVGNVLPNLNKIRVRFSIISNCDVDPNEPLGFNCFGMTNCQDSVLREFDTKLPISGFELIDSLSIGIIAPDTIQCTETGVITVNITNLLNTPTNPMDSVEIFLPDGFTYVSGLTSPNIIVTGSGTLLTWLLNPPLVANGSTSFNITVQADDSSNCASFDLPTSVFFGQPSPCGTGFCPEVRAYIDRDTTQTVICCNPCDVSALFLSDTVCIGDSICFDVIDQTTVAVGFNHEWDFGDGTTSTIAEPCHLYALDSVYTVTHIVTDLNTGCTDTATMTAVVTPFPEGVIEFLGCNPFCEGDSVFLTVNGIYDSIVWVNLTSGTPTYIGSYDTLIVTTTGIYNAVLFLGECVDSCLAISLTAQELPVIDIPDTVLCVSDSILVCAGGGYSEYLWTYNGNIINSTDSCIWVTEFGQYTVEVGEELLFGCCTCEGVDTFNISQSTISVTVPDLILCEGFTDSLCATVTGGTPVYTYLWSPTSDTTDCIFVDSAGVYVATVVDAMGCIGTDTGTVTILPFLPADFTFDDTICVNDTICFDSFNSGVNEWIVTNLSGQVITTSTDSVFCYLFPGEGTYEVTHILTNDPCGSDTVTHIATVVPPIEACIVMIGTNPFCVGDTVCLTVNDPFNQVVQIDWYLDGTFIGNADTMCVTEPGTYTALVYDNNGCTDSCMCIVLSQIPAPVVTLPDTLYICTGSNQIIDAGVGFSEYIWYRNDTAVAVGQTYTVTTEGLYKVRVMGVNGCYGYDTTLVILRDLFPIVVSSSDSVICIGETFTLSTLCDPNLSYVWERRSGGVWTQIPGFGTLCTQTVSSSQVFMSPTRFRVHIIDNLTGCEYFPEIRIRKVPCLGFAIVPVPSHDGRITVLYTLQNQEINNAVIEIVNIHGNVVRTVTLDTNVESQELDLSALANGVYFAKLITDGIVQHNEKFIIAQ